MDDAVKGLTFYAPIEKTDEDQRMVYGYASTEAMDSQGEIVSKDALKQALGDYMRFANIREMHQPSAVGKAKQANLDKKGLYVAVKVVDDNAWKKVKEGVYNGFSIGGRVLTKEEETITGLKLSEISLVDRPANPDATFDVFKADDMATKRDFSDKERKDLASSGKALPDGSFPIENEQDLRNAIRAIGRAKDPAKAKAHIKSRAKDLGATNLIPDSWKAEEVEGLKKDIGDAARIACIAADLEWMIANEKFEGDEVTVAALQAAQNALKDAAVSEIHEENDDVDEEVIMYAEPIKDLKKDDEVVEEPEAPTEEVEETTEIEAEAEPKTEVAETEEAEKTEEVETPEEKAEESKEEVETEESKEEEKADEPIDIVKLVDQKVEDGVMPTDEEIVSLLKTQEIEVTEATRDTLKFELAGLIVKSIEKNMKLVEERDALINKAKAILNEADVNSPKSNEERVELKKILDLVEKAEEELKKAEGDHATTASVPTPQEAESPRALMSQALAVLQRVAEMISNSNQGNQQSDSEKDKEDNGVNEESMRASGGHRQEDMEIDNPRKTAPVTAGEQPARMPGKSDETQDLQKVEALEATIQKLEARVLELEAQPEPVKVHASYTIVEKGFNGSTGDTPKNQLEKALVEVDEIAKQLKADPNNPDLIAKANSHAALIQKLQREANGSGN